MEWKTMGPRKKIINERMQHLKTEILILKQCQAKLEFTYDKCQAEIAKIDEHTTEENKISSMDVSFQKAIEIAKDKKIMNMFQHGTEKFIIDATEYLKNHDTNRFKSKDIIEFCNIRIAKLLAETNNLNKNSSKETIDPQLIKLKEKEIMNLKNVVVREQARGKIENIEHEKLQYALQIAQNSNPDILKMLKLMSMEFLRPKFSPSEEEIKFEDTNTGNLFEKLSNMNDKKNIQVNHLNQREYIEKLHEEILHLNSETDKVDSAMEEKTIQNKL